MSPHVGNFVQDLVEMAKATEELPKVQERLNEARKIYEEQAETIQRLELKLMERASELDTLNARLRTVEAERDDAILSFLEAEERTTRVLDFVKTTFGNAGALIQAIEPKGEPKAAPIEPQEVPTVVEPVVEPTPQASSLEPPVTAGVQQVHEPAPEPVGQSAMGEFGSNADFLGSDGVQPQAVSDTMNAPHSIEASHGPYSGKLYIQVYGWISRADWLAGGGTDATYDWREGQPLPDGIAA